MQDGRFLFSSESVTEGNPDKLCDRVADAVLDACLAEDAEARVSCEACTKAGMMMILGEVLTKANVNYEQVVREAVKAVGYDSDDKGLDWRTMNVIVAIEEQSPDLQEAITAGKADEAVLNDHGIVFGYASSETPEMMPLSHVLAVKLCAQLDKVRKDGSLSWVRPDGRAQVTIEYREDQTGLVPLRIHSVAMSAQNAPEIKQEQIEKDLMEQVLTPVLPKEMCDAKTAYHFVPCKTHVGSAKSDVGLAGRKVVADMYGGWGSCGDVSLSGKDGSKISRSGTYGARWAARNLVSANLCKRCLVQLSFSPSPAEPVSIHVNSYGTSKSCGKTDSELADILKRNFDFRPDCLQRDLGLKDPHFQKLSAHGHFGRGDADFAWEKAKDLR